MWIGFQIDASGRERAGDAHRRHALTEKLEQLSKNNSINGLLIWAHNDSETIDKLVSYCLDRGIESYLWYPVLADTPSHSPAEGALVENCFGKRGIGDICTWDKLGEYASGRETFQFGCPNKSEEMNKIFDLYTHQLDSFRFDGVFLDRIRYPSAAVGFEMLFSCFCEKCRSAFLECYGAGLHDYRVIALDWIEKLRRMPASILRSASSLKDILFPRKLEPFLRFRNKSIYKVTKKFSDYAKSQGKKVGLDLYSYSLSDSVGQDYRLLSTVCDWMKPMIYCHTNAPAGLPLELNTLVQSLLHLNTRLEGQQVSALFSDILKITLPNPRDLLRTGIPESLIIQEMNRIMRLDLNPRVHLYPGIEAMRMADVCIINRRILRSYLENVSSVNARGVVFSWNLLDIPTDHLEFIGTSLGAEDA